MTQLCCYRVWDGSLERFRRGVMLLATIDLLLISTVIVYVGISLYQVSFMDSPSSHHSDSKDRLLAVPDNETDSAVNDIIACVGSDGGEVDCEGSDIQSKNLTESGRHFPGTPYFQVVGSRIAKSIQLIIYTVQLFVTVLLIRGLLRTDTHCMRTWLIVTEIITTIIFLVLILYLFGDFKGTTVLILGTYVIYQFVMIRTVARLIRRTEIELTQFGSIVEF